MAVLNPDMDRIMTMGPILSGLLYQSRRLYRIIIPFRLSKKSHNDTIRSVLQLRLLLKPSIDHRTQTMELHSSHTGGTNIVDLRSIAKRSKQTYEAANRHQITATTLSTRRFLAMNRCLPYAQYALQGSSNGSKSRFYPSMTQPPAWLVYDVLYNKYS